jgi:hypothetical protein
MDALPATAPRTGMDANASAPVAADAVSDKVVVIDPPFRGENERGAWFFDVTRGEVNVPQMRLTAARFDDRILAVIANAYGVRLAVGGFATPIGFQTYEWAAAMARRVFAIAAHGDLTVTASSRR